MLQQRNKFVRRNQLNGIQIQMVLGEELIDLEKLRFYNSILMLSKSEVLGNVDRPMSNVTGKAQHASSIYS